MQTSAVGISEIRESRQGGPNEAIAFIEFACDRLDLENPNAIAYELIDQDKIVAYEAGAGSRVAAEWVYMGRRSYGNSSCFVSPRVLIGRYCSIGPYAGVGITRHEMNWLSTGYIENNKPPAPTPQGWTTIQNDVWIGYGAMVKGGKDIVIGHGACIGAGAMITDSVPPYAVMAGNPAHLLRYRFPPDIIDGLIRTRWWTLPPMVIATLPIDNIEACVEELLDMRG